MTSRVIITIDGPAGTGKSTVAHQLAQRLGLEFLDTGAMYRAAALVALEAGIDPQDVDAVTTALDAVTVHFDWNTPNGEPPRIRLDERDVSEAIRAPAVNEIVSTIAAHADVRTRLVNAQRRIADQHPRMVTEGRDQGSVVFPEAPVKFFLHADEQVRAQRRSDQLRNKGMDVPMDELVENIRRRDHIDSTRTDGPLIKPDGAIEVDTGAMDIGGVVDHLEGEVRRRIGALIDAKQTAAAREGRAPVHPTL